MIFMDTRAEDVLLSWFSPSLGDDVSGGAGSSQPANICFHGLRSPLKPSSVDVVVVCVQDVVVCTVHLLTN